MHFKKQIICLIVLGIIMGSQSNKLFANFTDYLVDRFTQKDTLNGFERIFSHKSLRSEYKGNKTLGIEVNLFRLVYFEEYPTLSGTLAYYCPDNASEIAFPVYYSEVSSKIDGLNNLKNIRVLNADIHYRHYSNESQDNNYMGIFCRYNYRRGMVKTDPNEKEVIMRAHRIGVGVETGYKFYAKNHFYLGYSACYGCYVYRDYKSLNSDSYTYHKYNDLNLIWDVELLKLGFTF